MRRMLAEANLDILRQGTLLIGLIDRASTPKLLGPYRRRIRELCESLAADARQNLDDLKHDLPNTFAAILSKTQAVMAYLEILNTRFTGPILRYRDDDEIMLAVLDWLHSTHGITKAHPFAFGDGAFSVYHDLKFPSIYFLPASRQQTLLYVPFFFHEFGHVLYRFHKAELDVLVGNFQNIVAEYAAAARVPVGRDSVGDQRRKLVSAWYSWTQEFFCDAVGLGIGGLGYLQAFSHYFRLRSKDQYFRPRHIQLESRHPLSRLRLHLLLKRAGDLAFAARAKAIEADWTDCAKLMSVEEDHHGTWSEDLMAPLRRTLDLMMATAGTPIHERLAAKSNADPARTCNAAWDQFERSPDSYNLWEATMVDRMRKGLGGGMPWQVVIP